MTLYTIGFTKRSADSFFGALKKSGARRLIDVRLNNTSQLAGFTKRDDLVYFLRDLCGMEYFHASDCAPTQEMLDAYKKKKGAWGEFERSYAAVIAARRLEERYPWDFFDEAVLLCSESEAERCHRRLLAEHLAQVWPRLEIVHL